MLPSRVINPTRALRVYGPVAEQLFAALREQDTPADTLVEALRDPRSRVTQAMLEQSLLHSVSKGTPAPLREFVHSIESLPPWLDRSRLERGQKVLLRSGLLGGLVLGARSLIYGYTAPAGNKPLVFSGRLQTKAQRRLAETAKFVQSVVSPGGMERDGEGLLITARVRLMHAQVRRLIWDTGRWQAEDWGAPINQHDMVATILLFSIVLLDGLRALGMKISTQEADDYVHLWRYVGHVIGVKPVLLPDTEREARTLQNCIAETQGEPDEDSIALVRGLLDIRLRMAKTEEERLQAQKHILGVEGLVRGLLGDPLADQLRISNTSWRWIVPTIRTLVQPIEAVRSRVPLLATLFEHWGLAYWSSAVARDLGKQHANFARPETLFG